MSYIKNENDGDKRLLIFIAKAAAVLGTWAISFIVLSTFNLTWQLYLTLPLLVAVFMWSVVAGSWKPVIDKFVLKPVDEEPHYIRVSPVSTEDKPTPPPTQVERSPRIDRKNKRVPRRLREVLHKDEAVEKMRRLHYAKLVPWGVVTVGSFAAIGYISSQPNDALVWMIVMIVGFAALVSIPIYRQISQLYKAVRWWHLVIAVAALLISVVLFRNHLVAIGQGIIDVFQWVGHALQLTDLSLQTAMSLIAEISLVQFVIRFIEWWTNPALVTNRRIIVVQGLIVREYPSMSLRDITDETFKRINLPLPFGTLILESPGQTQGITKVPWFPVKLIKEIPSEEKTIE